MEETIMSSALLLQGTLDGILIGGVYATIAVGLSLAFGVMRIVNFAHGEFLMVAMYLAFLLVMGTGMDPYLTMLVTIPVMFIIGYCLQRGIFNRMLDRSTESEPMSILIFTAGLSIFLSNMATVIFGSNIKAAVTKYTSTSFSVGDIIVSIPRFISFIIAIAFTIMLYIIIQRTEYGRALRATAQNRRVAELMGINYKKIYAIAFGLGLALIGVSASLLVPNSSVSPTIGDTYGIKCFIIVVLGGLGSIPGALVGGIILGLIEKVGAVFMSDAYAQLIEFIVFVLMLLFRPAGLFGRETNA
jgi:branched-chain amino acid transport system permease protein